MDVTIRRLRTGDETRAREVAAAFKSGAVPEAHAARFLADPANVLLVAEDDGDLVGFVLGYKMQRLDRPACQLFVYEIEVSADHRRQGVGTRFIEAIRELVREESMMEAFVMTDRGNPAAMALYESTGGQQADEGILFVYPGESG